MGTNAGSTVGVAQQQLAFGAWAWIGGSFVPTTSFFQRRPEQCACLSSLVLGAACDACSGAWLAAVSLIAKLMLLVVARLIERRSHSLKAPEFDP